MTIWHDVHLDAVTAGRAIDALRAVADHLDVLTDTRARLAGTATADWVGEQRDRFDTDLASLVDASLAVAARLRDGAATIESDLRVAHAEQRRRLDAREAARAEARLEAMRRAEQRAQHEAGDERP